MFHIVVHFADVYGAINILELALLFYFLILESRVCG